MRFPNIQFLRVVAAGAVVLVHLAHYAGHLFHVPLSAEPGKWAVFPVPLFFAVSGFVLAHALQTAPPGRFLVARFLRLYPGYWLAVGLVVPLMWFTVWPAEFRHYVRPGTIGWALLPGEPGSCVYPLGVEWSLVYEVFLSAALAGMSLFGVRRGVPVAAAAWLVLLGVKVAVWPGYASDPLPRWQTVALSGFNVPFLLGVLAYYGYGYGRRWRWAVLAGLVAFLVVVPGRTTTLEETWCVYGAAAAAAAWVAVQLRQVSAANPLARLGDYTYGLYLVHVPVITGVFYLLLARGWLLDSTVGVLLAGAAAVAGGLLYGKLESALHARLRPLARVKVRGVRTWPARVRGWVMTRRRAGPTAG